MADVAVQTVFSHIIVAYVKPILPENLSKKSNLKCKVNFNLPEVFGLG